MAEYDTVLGEEELISSEDELPAAVGSSWQRREQGPSLGRYQPTEEEMRDLATGYSVLPISGGNSIPPRMKAAANNPFEAAASASSISRARAAVAAAVAASAAASAWSNRNPVDEDVIVQKMENNKTNLINPYRKKDISIHESIIRTHTNPLFCAACDKRFNQEYQPRIAKAELNDTKNLEIRNAKMGEQGPHRWESRMQAAVRINLPAKEDTESGSDSEFAAAKSEIERSNYYS